MPHSRKNVNFLNLFETQVSLIVCEWWHVALDKLSFGVKVTVFNNEQLLNTYSVKNYADRRGCCG